MQIVLAQQRKRASAYTLAEVLVASAVLGLMFLSLYAGVSSGVAVIQVARENLRATQILQEKMETIRLYTWDQINTTNFVPLKFTENFYSTSTNDGTGLTYTGKVAITSAGVTESYSNDLKKVSIQVNWLSGKKLRTRDMSTFVTKHGLQDYIY